MKNLKYFLALLCIAPGLGHASLNFYTTEFSVESPSKLEVKNSLGKTLTFMLQGPRFEQNDLHSCSSSSVAKKRCLRLTDLLRGKKLGVIIERKADGIVYGDIVLDDVVLSAYMISRGWYRVDISHTRNHALLLAEKEAFCHYRGIWAKNRGLPEVASKCQEL